MTTLTKEQRHEVYKLTLDIYKTSRYNYACESIREALIKLHGYEVDCGYQICLQAVPEFLAKKPNYSFLVWWDDRESRIEALTQCIEETKP